MNLYHDIKRLQTEKENIYFDRKSSRIEPKDIVRHIIGFANANGGTLAIGIEDKGELTGFASKKSHMVGEYDTAILKNCIPIPMYKMEQVRYGKDDNDFVLLITVEMSTNQVVRTHNEKVYLRVGDNTIELTYSQIRALEYDKGQRYFEDQLIEDSSIDDIDRKILYTYKEKMHVLDKPDEELLAARGLMRNGKLTNAAVLLFGKYPTRYLPSARVRFIRYDGKQAGVGRDINIIKDQTFDDAIPVLIDNVTYLVRAQLRDFQMLTETGKFEIIPEYPEFAWFEGIVNAVVHRDYRVRGEYIRIVMYDDRLEIFSPGRLPNMVTLDNMKYTRYSRNPIIARFLAEYGWVKELNEGVKRIYSEMQSFFLNDPVYTEPNSHAVLLTLDNSITSRHLRASDRLSQEMFEGVWADLSENEKHILHYVYARGEIRTKDAAKLIGRGNITAGKILREMVENHLLVWHGTSNNDPGQYYTLKV